MSRDPPSFFLSFPSRELRLSPPQMSVSLRLGSILRSVPLLRRPTMPLPCYQLRLSIFLFPIPFLLSLSRSSFPLFAFWLFELSPSLLRSFPYRRFSTSSTLLSRRIFPTKNNGTHVVGCLLPCTVASTNIYLFSFFFILDFSSSSIFHQNSFDCPKKIFLRPSFYPSFNSIFAS